MKYVTLVPDRVCKTPIEVRINGEGLTERGRALVRECNALRIIIDLSHLNEKG